MHKIIVWGIAVLLLAGCASQQKWQDYREREMKAVATEPQLSDEVSYYHTLRDQQTSYTSNRIANAKLQQRYQASHHHAQLNHYVQAMMHDLIAVMDPKFANAVFAVTSFVYLDGAYDDTDLLGNQLAESFMHEVHQFGLMLIDFKTTDFIRVTPAGDFAFSRDFLELREEQPIEYVLGGTLVRHQSGVMVNARLVGIDSKRILASAQGFIPQPVIAALQPSQHRERILLKQGAE